MTLRAALVLSLACIAVPVAAASQLPEGTRAELPAMQHVGEARFVKWLMHVYDATLWAADPRRPLESALALELRYARGLRGGDIADRSAEEMRRQGVDEGKLARWLPAMKEIFPDVRRGDRLVGVLRANGTTRFFRDGRPIGDVDDPAFGRAFFGIWLREDTSEPDMRRALLGHPR